jgi:peptidoglycan-associated lipoprotein
MMKMRRVLLLSMSLSALFLAGCPSKPKNGECKSSDDCKDQQGYGKICVQGRCQECGADTDCKAGFVCRQNKCAPRPECESNADCPGGGTCENGRCAAPQSKAECDSDAQCGPGKSCQGGKCLASSDNSAAASAEAVARCVGDDKAVYFGFDKADLDDASRNTLDKMADCLKAARGAQILVEGHCDQRGTTEYNIQLGDRRAEAVKKYLVNLGLQGSAVRTTSYGKEKPVCNEQNESCWAKNRRGVVRPAGAGGSSSLFGAPTEQQAWR